LRGYLFSLTIIEMCLAIFLPGIFNDRIRFHTGRIGPLNLYAGSRFQRHSIVHLQRDSCFVYIDDDGSVLSVSTISTAYAKY
jgi:hypothetical protein